MKAKPGSNMTLSCQVRGIPKPSVTWWHNASGDIKVMPKKMQGKENELRIVGVKEADMGIYMCIAKNKLGIASRGITLELGETSVELTRDNISHLTKHFWIGGEMKDFKPNFVLDSIPESA